MNDSGIYIITNISNGKVYIGQSRQLNGRKYKHFHSLEKGTHYNKHLQRAYSKYGPDSFTFSILEYCEVEELNQREQYWISKFHAMDLAHGYNNEGGGNVDKIVSERTRESKRGANNPNYGKKTPEETRIKMRNASRGKNTELTEQQVYDIKERLLHGASAKNLGKTYGISEDAVLKIKMCKNWEYVHSDINEKLISMTEEQRKLRDRLIFEFSLAGLSRNRISQMLGCTAGTVAKVLGTRSPFFTDSPIKCELKKLVVADFLSGMPREEIKTKYDISDAKYVSLISEAYSDKRNKAISEANRLRSEGVMVKDIAAKLGYARTTISKWTDQSEASKTSDAHNKKRNEDIAEAIRLRSSGVKVKDIATKLGYSRITISTWTKHLIE